ncbi:MAG TPA: respiratory nitrate reductase subunit gamma [Bacillales bacterium]|nr:respiratory nitrate reductase subunit gamma [Bacillales bacterium]
MTEIFFWVIFPYIAGTVMIFGLLYRFAFRQLTWAAPSTEIFEKKKLRLGSQLFHWGIIFAFIGHIMGIIIPHSVYDFFNVPDEWYHTMAILTGGAAGLMIVVGLFILLVRKFAVPRVRAHTSFADYYSIVLLLLVSGLGAYMTIVYNTTVVAYEYRTTIGPWFRSLFIFQPRYELMTAVPLLFQVHVVIAFLLFASIPFTKLVHFFALPIRYPARAPQQYRARDGYRGRE